MAKQDKETVEEPRAFAISVRSMLYLTAFFFIFSLTVAELGLVSEQLHKYGNSYINYASMQYKHALGLLLFSVIASLLLMLSHPWLGVGFISFSSFVMAVFFGTGAGIIQRSAPFTGHGCSRKPLQDYPPAWQPYVGECSRVVAIQGIAWSLWGLYIFLLVGTIIHKFQFTARATPEAFYRSKV